MIDVLLAVDSLFAVVGIVATFRVLRQAMEMRRAVKGFHAMNPVAPPSSPFHAPAPEDLT